MVKKKCKEKKSTRKVRVIFTLRGRKLFHGDTVKTEKSEYSLSNVLFHDLMELYGVCFTDNVSMHL